MIGMTTFGLSTGAGWSSSFEQPIPQMRIVTPIKTTGTKTFITPSSDIVKRPFYPVKISNILKALHFPLLKPKKEGLTIKN